MKLNDWNRLRDGMSTFVGAATFAFGVASTAPVLAQGAFDLENWDYDAVYDGWSAERLLDEAEVFGERGEEIGSIENLLINDQGQIVALVAQVGGVWDIGDTHVAVPWDEATFDGFDVTIPVTEENIDDYSIFADEYFTQHDVGSLETVEDDVDTGFDIWKATDLVDDYAVLETGAGYGYVKDLIFDDGGKLQGVVVSADGGYVDGAYGAYYAYPWYGYGYDGYAWDPALDSYVLPFDEDEISDFTTAFEYDTLDGGVS